MRVWNKGSPSLMIVHKGSHVKLMACPPAESTPSRIRTCDLLVRNELLYPAELPGRAEGGLDSRSELSWR